MDIALVSVISSGITAGLVIVIPLVKSIVDNRFERNARLYENELTLRRSVYEEFLSMSAKLFAMNPKDRHEFYDLAMRVCLYCNADAKELIRTLVKSVERCGSHSSSETLGFAVVQAAFDNKKKDGSPQSIDAENSLIFEISESLGSELYNLSMSFSKSLFSFKKIRLAIPPIGTNGSVKDDR